MFSTLKKLFVAYIANNFKLSNKLTRVNDNLIAEIKKAQRDSQSLLTKAMENEIFALRDSLLPLKTTMIRENHFLLFHYNKNVLQYSNQNLGDFIQTIATKNALLSLNPKTTFEFFDRDSLLSYYPAGGGGEIAL